MKIPFNADQLKRSIDSARKIVAAFDTNQTALLARAYGQIPDGYPTGGNGLSAKNDISDTTGNTAVARAKLTEQPGHAILALQALNRAFGELDIASTHLGNALPPAPVIQRPDELWCTSCQRDRGYCEPRGDGRGELCRWCHDFRGVHDVLPPVELLELRHAGRRIYDRDITAALARLAGSNT